MAKKEIVPYYDVQTGEVKDALAEIAAKHAPSPVSQEQLDAWKRAPREQALKEALDLFKLQGIDVTEARFKLDVLRFISELQGAQVPQAQGGAVIQIFVNQPSEPRRIVTVTPPLPSQSSSEEAEKKEAPADSGGA